MSVQSSKKKNAISFSKTHFFLHDGSGLVEKFEKKIGFLHVAVQGFGTVEMVVSSFSDYRFPY